MSDGVEPDDQKKVVKEIPVIYDEGTFVHETGDTYEGSFEAKKKDHSLKMSAGHGVYTTAEGDQYSGTWEADRLIDEATISYTDGSKYEGPLKDWTYNGNGKYTFPDSTTLTTEFLDNCPIKEMTLMDPNGHVWLGRAEIGFGWLDPCNHFYQGLERSSEKSASSQEKAVLH